MRRCLQPPNDLAHDRLRLLAVGFAAASLVDAALHMNVAHGIVASDGGRKGDQFASVIFGVGKGDQAFMAAAVVPLQPHARNVRGETFVEDALLTGQNSPIVVIAAIGGAFPDAGRRKLFGVADDDRLIPARDGADGVPYLNLRSLVENHDIEGLGVRRQILGDR